MDYVRNQERRHARRTFRDEYLRFLKRYEIEHDEKYIFLAAGLKAVQVTLPGFGRHSEGVGTINRPPLRGLRPGYLLGSRPFPN
jgi:hypothetical protein